VLENQNILAANIQKHREFIKAFNPSGKSRALQEMDHNRNSFASCGIQERILNILGRRFFHSTFPFVFFSLDLYQRIISNLRGLTRIFFRGQRVSMFHCFTVSGVSVFQVFQKF